jgi:hypothetical protein
MKLYPISDSVEHPIGAIVNAQGSPGAGWVLCDGSNYLKSSYPEYVNNCVDLHPLRFQKYERLTFTNTPSVRIKSVAINGNTIVMVGGTTRYHWRSTDGGDNWTEYSTNLPSSQDWRIVRYANSQFVAVGYNSTVVAYSSDGITWSSASALSSSGLWEHLIWDGTQWILYASDGGTYFTSSNGSTWTQRSSMPSPDKSGIAVDLNNNELMIISEATSPYIYHSTDGINWTNKEYFEYQFRPYDMTVYASNVMYFPDSDKWMFTIDDITYGINQVYVSYDDGDTWSVELLGSRWAESYQFFQNGTLWDGDCHIWFVVDNYFRGYYQKDGGAWVNFSGPGFNQDGAERPCGFDAEYERFMIVPSFESSESSFDYIYKYFYGDYDPQTKFCVPNLIQKNQPGIDSYIRIQ